MTGKQIKGEKYIYLSMAYKLAKQQTKDYISIGNDNGMIGGQNFWRAFSIQEYNGEILLIETKTTAHSANFTRTFVVVDNEENDRLYIYEYLNEDNENGSTCWIH